MKTIRLLILLCLSVSILSGAEPGVVRENIEWCDVWMPNSNASGQPRVLLIGDSITRAYFPAVERTLKDRAYVSRVCTSKSLGDPALVPQLIPFLAEQKFDVIHFNNGMHGWGYSEEAYGVAYPGLMEALQKVQPTAKIILATTTPVRAEKTPGPTNARVKARNATVVSLAAEHKWAVDDLYALMDGKPELHSDDVHFGKEGQELQAAQVAKSILAVLPETKSPASH